jgi:hypothetical protein
MSRGEMYWLASLVTIAPHVSQDIAIIGWFLLFLAAMFVND